MSVDWRWWIAGAVLIATATGLGRFRGEPGRDAAAAALSNSVVANVPDGLPSRPSAAPASQIAPVRYSPLAGQLVDPATSPEDEVCIVQQLFSQYRSALQNRPGPPVGDNQDLVKVLTGRNPLKRSLLPPGFSRIDGQGRLMDRWGRPFHIHAISSRWIEVRSAGPDGTLFNADDAITGSGRALLDDEDEVESMPDPR